MQTVSGRVRVTLGFKHYVAVPVSVSVAVSVKTVSVRAVPYAVAGGVRGSSVAGSGGRLPSFPRKRGGTPGILAAYGMVGTEK